MCKGRLKLSYLRKQGRYGSSISTHRKEKLAKFCGNTNWPKPLTNAANVFADLNHVQWTT